MERIINFFFSPTPLTVAESVADALSGFTTTMAKLEAAVAQGNAEIDASETRVEVAWNNYLEVRDVEEDFRDVTADATNKAASVRLALADLLGEGV